MLFDQVAMEKGQFFTLSCDHSQTHFTCMNGLIVWPLIPKMECFIYLGTKVWGNTTFLVQFVEPSISISIVIYNSYVDGYYSESEPLMRPYNKGIKMVDIIWEPSQTSQKFLLHGVWNFVLENPKDSFRRRESGSPFEESKSLDYLQQNKVWPRWETSWVAQAFRALSRLNNLKIWD